MNTVSAITLRKKLGEIMDSVYHTGEDVIVERKGKPYIRLSPIKIETKKKGNFLDLAGIITEEEGARMLKMMREGRNDGSRNKKYLLKW